MSCHCALEVLGGRGSALPWRREGSYRILHGRGKYCNSKHTVFKSPMQTCITLQLNILLREECHVCLPFVSPLQVCTLTITAAHLQSSTPTSLLLTTSMSIQTKSSPVASNWGLPRTYHHQLPLIGAFLIHIITSCL